MKFTQTRNKEGQPTTLVDEFDLDMHEAMSHISNAYVDRIPDLLEESFYPGTPAVDSEDLFYWLEEEQFEAAQVVAAPNNYAIPNNSNVIES